MRSAINTFRNALNEESQLEQAAPSENTHEKRDNAYAKVDKSIRRGLLGSLDHIDDDADAAAKNANDVENFYEAAYELLLEREVNETRKEVLFVRHVASWLDFDEEPGFLLGTAIG